MHNKGDVQADRCERLGIETLAVCLRHEYLLVVYNNIAIPAATVHHVDPGSKIIAAPVADTTGALPLADALGPPPEVLFPPPLLAALHPLMSSGKSCVEFLSQTM